ncbi:MAG TPA: hypothetical protein PK413_07775 [Thermoanaerobaculia bacterium]|nr:hypothetical protein [Thermoanaerobaculia bacterium]
MSVEALRFTAISPTGSETGAAKPTAPASQAQSFESFLEAASRLQHDPQAATTIPGANPLHIDPRSLPGGDPSLAAASPEPGKQPLTAARFVDGAEKNYLRMNDLLSRLEGAEPMTSRDLLAMQIEISKITLALETTTRTVAQATQDVRQLFQQQI